MERLTRHGEDGKGYFKALDPDCTCNRECPRLWDHMQMLTERLAAYEDTGLEPEEIKAHEAAYIEIMTRTYGTLHQKIGQWLQAEQDGRLLVLPCKLGDTVYQTDGVRLYESTVRSVIFDTENVSFDECAIGKTVFLTREEAEAALKGGEG